MVCGCLDNIIGFLRSRSYSGISENRYCKPAKGYLPIYVGNAKQRFEVPIKYLSHQAMMLLLQMSEEEYGFVSYSGGLHIPCDVSLFELAMEQADQFFRSPR